MSALPTLLRQTCIRCTLVMLIVISGVMLAPSAVAAQARSASVTILPFSTTSPIAVENGRQGTTSWLIPASADTSFIQGYAGQVSALPGESVRLFVSAATPVAYSLAVYRLGWYHGAGAREITWVNSLRARSQGIWSSQTGLRGCGSCTADPATHLVDAHWQISYTLHIGDDWLSGVYLIKLVADNGSMAYIPLVVRDGTAHSAALAMIAVNTYQAYNLWGGYDLYGNAYRHFAQRATKVSFNRPYARSAGAGDLLYWDIQSIRWMERLGLDVRYTTDADVSIDPASLLHHQVVLSLGHHEYWTAAMRDGLTAARDHGVSLAFLGANDGYWQVRYEPDKQGHANRVVVCYKVATHTTDPTMRLSRDPMYAVNPHLVTAQFRDPVIAEPENALIGIMYESMTRANDDPDWVVAADNTDPFARDADLTTGEHIKGSLVGYEYDGSYADGAQPSDLVVLAASPVTNIYRVHQTALTTYYRAASGALVFAAGTIWWSWGLDAFTWSTGYSTANRLRGNARISALTASLIRAMLATSPTP
jgi:hypothetical protein